MEQYIDERLSNYMEDTREINEVLSRPITSPETEPSARGPQESFVEDLRFNTVLLRRIIKSPGLKVEIFKLGKLSSTDVALIYLEDITDEKLVTEVRKRLSRIDIDAVFESGCIEELIEDNPWSPFPTINHTGRPDRAAAMLLEGRVAVLVDGTPVALTMPNLFIEYLQGPGDYYERYIFATAVRVIRLIAMITALILPSLYVAVLSFHQELLPTPLFLNIAAQRDMLPFPIFLEVLGAELSYEVLREAGNRLPRPVGSVVSTVAALLLGSLAVWAGLFSAITPLVIVFAGLAFFLVADSAGLTLRLLRFVLLMLSGALGLLGLLSGLTFIAIYMCTLRSFGVPYLAPFAPFIGSDLDDAIFRAPWWALFSRPRLLMRENRKRQGRGMKPNVR